jgi:hypothetical protein
MILAIVGYTGFGIILYWIFKNCDAAVKEVRDRSVEKKKQCPRQQDNNHY